MKYYENIKVFVSLLPSSFVLQNTSRITLPEDLKQNHLQVFQHICFQCFIRIINQGENCQA